MISSLNMRAFATLVLLTFIYVQCSFQQASGKNPCSGKGEECVPHRNCRNHTIERHGAVLIVFRSGIEITTPCPNPLHVCCQVEEVFPDTATTATHKPEKCGYRNDNTAGIFVSNTQDNEAQFAEFPWMTAIFTETQLKDKKIELFKCGGSLVTPTIVMTVAHCVYDMLPSTLKARAGDWDVLATTEPHAHQERIVADIVIHENYKKGSQKYDIALLVLQSPMTLAKNVGTICLPLANQNFDNARCVATGWGMSLNDQFGKYQNILKKVDLPIVPKARCEAALQTTRLGPKFQLHPTLLCAGGEAGKDMCTGDGGSPLVCPVPGNPTQYYQAGIVVGGIGCFGDIPAVYANIPKLRNWLDRKLATLEASSVHYTV